MGRICLDETRECAQESCHVGLSHVTLPVGAPMSSSKKYEIKVLFLNDCCYDNIWPNLPWMRGSGSYTTPTFCELPYSFQLLHLWLPVSILADSFTVSDCRPLHLVIFSHELPSENLYWAGIFYNETVTGDIISLHALLLCLRILSTLLFVYFLKVIAIDWAFRKLEMKHS